VRITSKGQVTIPKDVRDQAGFMPGSEIDFVVENDAVRLVKATDGRQRDIARRIASVRGSLKTRFSTDELMALLRGED
jgi:antitoxin PrlF